MSDLSVAWIGANSYAVHSPGDGDPDNAYRVRLDAIGQDGQTSCSCKHGSHNDATPETCRHVRAAIAAHPSEPDLERFAFEQLTDLYVDVHDALRDVPSGGMSGPQSGTEAGSGTSADADGKVDRSAEPSDEQAERLSDVEGWIAQAAGFHGFDPSIVEAEWAEAEGTPGVAVDTTPFPGGYHDGDSWQDQDGFDDERETFRDAMKGQDEIEWYGEPDYDNFVAADTIPELVN